MGHSSDDNSARKVIYQQIFYPNGAGITHT